MQILCGDIGGTKTTLAFMEFSTGGDIHMLCRNTYPSREYASLEELLEEFLQEHAIRPDAATFGVAGPVMDDRCNTTNLPWTIETPTLKKLLKTNLVWLINDLEANAWGIQALEERDFCVLNAGKPNSGGNCSIISAGTGLGEAGMFWNGQQHVPFASEGGHASFSPVNDDDIALLRFLRQRQPNVSWETVVSGKGLVNIHDFLLNRDNAQAPPWLQQAMIDGDPAAAISQAAHEGHCPRCQQAMDIFVHLYGVEAGNHALKMMATGGVYIGGGIAPKILAQLQGPRFLDGFFSKGSMEPLMRDMPVTVILNPDTALLGAAIHARQRA